MAETKNPNVPEDMRTRQFIYEVMMGVVLSLGMALLWVMEHVRNVVFWMLDRAHIPARKRRRASAYPPGPQAFTGSR
jgi:hypothetical protein